MKDKHFDDFISKLLYPDFEVFFEEVEASDKQVNFFLLGVLSRCAYEAAKRSNYTPSICVKGSDDSILFNNILNVKVPYDFLEKTKLISLKEFDFVFHEDFHNYLCCFIKEDYGTSEKHTCKAIPIYKAFSELEISDFYEFIAKDVAELKQNLSNTDAVEVSVGIKLHRYNPENRIWEIIFIE